jgi:hypothetical protein
MSSSARVAEFRSTRGLLLTSNDYTPGVFHTLCSAFWCAGGSCQPRLRPLPPRVFTRNPRQAVGKSAHRLPLSGRRPPVQDWRSPSCWLEPSSGHTLRATNNPNTRAMLIPASTHNTGPSFGVIPQTHWAEPTRNLRCCQYPGIHRRAQRHFVPGCWSVNGHELLNDSLTFHWQGLLAVSATPSLCSRALRGVGDVHTTRRS